MNEMMNQFFPVFGAFIVLMFITGIYCVMVAHNFIRVLIGLEILTKGVTLLIILAGYVTGRVALAQALAITLIVIEVVVIAVASGVIVSVFKRNHSLDVTMLRNLKG